MNLKEDTLLKLLQDIENRMARLEKIIREDNKNVHLDIKNIQTLNLDKLIYKLDKVDIKELSGALNIGNTFQTGDLHSSEQTAMEQNQRKTGHQDIVIKVNGKQIPYRTNEEIPAKTKKISPFDSEFKIGDIHIGTIEDASAVNFGNNFPTDFRSHKKHNQGFGNIIGDHHDIHDMKTFMKEREATEVYNENQDGREPSWAEEAENEDEAH